MTCKEAHKFLEIKQREMTIKRHLYSNEQAIEINGLAIEALEKQIPKKPTKTRSEIVCPTCKTLVGSSPYCRYCGQALDWGNTK